MAALENVLILVACPGRQPYLRSFTWLVHNCSGEGLGNAWPKAILHLDQVQKNPAATTVAPRIEQWLTQIMGKTPVAELSHDGHASTIPFSG
jgi:hypothetical protein